MLVQVYKYLLESHIGKVQTLILYFLYRIIEANSIQKYSSRHFKLVGPKTIPIDVVLEILYRYLLDIYFVIYISFNNFKFFCTMLQPFFFWQISANVNSLARATLTRYFTDFWYSLWLVINISNSWCNSCNNIYSYKPIDSLLEEANTVISSPEDDRSVVIETPVEVGIILSTLSVKILHAFSTFNIWVFCKFTDFERTFRFFKKQFGSKSKNFGCGKL